MKALLFLLVSFFLCCSPFYSQSSFKLISDNPVIADFVVTDELGNVYLMTGSSIERINALGKGVYRASELQWGEFHDVDVTDPLRPFVHFPASGKVVFFDNTLSVQGSPIDLFEAGFDNVEWMCGSRGDGYWLWDGRNSELVRVDRSFKKSFSTGNLSMLLNHEIHPIGMTERGSYLYLLCEDSTLHVFDMFGTWKKRIFVERVKNWMADADNLYLFHSDGSLEVIDTRTWLSERMNLPLVGSAYCFQAGRLYVLSDGRLRTYDFVETIRN